MKFPMARRVPSGLAAPNVFRAVGPQKKTSMDQPGIKKDAAAMARCAQGRVLWPAVGWQWFCHLSERTLPPEQRGLGTIAGNCKFTVTITFERPQLADLTRHQPRKKSHVNGPRSRPNT